MVVLKMGHVVSSYPWTVLVLAFSVVTYLSALSLDRNPGPELEVEEFEPVDHLNTSRTVAPVERQVISVPRGSSLTAVCGNETIFSLVKANYAETAASKSKPAFNTRASCDRSANLALAETIYEECPKHSVSCLINARDSLNTPGCRWKFLVVTYDCTEVEESVGMAMTGFMLDE